MANQWTCGDSRDGLDDPAQVATPRGLLAEGPLLSSLQYDKRCRGNGWDVALWINIMTFPGTKTSDEFYTEFEAWLYRQYSDDQARVLPEWSKGWAYTEAGAWTSETRIREIRATFGTREWERWRRVLKRYDQHSIFTNAFLDQLVGGED